MGSRATAVAPGPAIITRFVDFWLLGGASIALWAAMATGDVFRSRMESVQNHFLQVGALFSLLSIFCNYPHFMISYRFGYGRGAGFIACCWFKLIAVPAALVALYAYAYLHFDAQIGSSAAVVAANGFFERLGVAFRLGTLDNLGTEILSLSVWLMYATVGWHYSKQVFGCMMVYAKYDGYPITRRQRNLIKASVFAVALYNFFYIAGDASSGSMFLNVPLVSLGLPQFLTSGAFVAVVALDLAAFYGVVWRGKRLNGKWPSVNFLVPWLAFHVWWIPLVRQKEFYFLALPFFHSLQYLPFAYRLEAPEFKGKSRLALRASLHVALWLAIGLCAFEWLPNLLDHWLRTEWTARAWFFTVAFAVFINVHHFFIDSAVWKFDQPQVRDRLLKPA